MKILLTATLLFVLNYCFGQNTSTPFIKLQNPGRTSNDVRWSRNFIVGATCKNCGLKINGAPVKVYSTGAFAYELNLVPGDTSFTIIAEGDAKSTSKKISYSYTLPKPAEPVKTLSIESIQTFPEGDLVLQTGDVIKFKVKALPHSVVKVMQNTPLYELPVEQTNGMPGIYQGAYRITDADSFTLKKIPLIITDSLGKIAYRETASRFSILSPLAVDIALTKGRLAHLEYGLGDDRLGGAKIGYIDSNIVLKITGKVGSHYRVKLAKAMTAYIPDELVKLAPKGTFSPGSLTSNFSVYGDDKYDYVKVGLFQRLPYQSFQMINPSTIVVDVFGATNNTNWIAQLETAKEIYNVYYEQKEDDIFRITIQLKHHQFWGHTIYYAGNTLVIKIKQQPQKLALKNLTIAIDAGHGGSNTGAAGPTGVLEKDLALAVAIKLQQAFEKEGAKVIMTRTKEQFFDNKDRILFYRDSVPDLLLSFHLNSSSDPINVGGTGAFYRYIGFKNLSNSIYKRMLELGLKEYGNTGSFNFMLNSPTEYPNALIEALFLSNLEEEEKILDPKFQDEMVEKIVQGVKDFLEKSKAPVSSR